MSRILLGLALAALPIVCPAWPAFAAAGWQEGFEGPQPSWQATAPDPRDRLTAQQRVHDQAHSGQGCEYLQVQGGGGTGVVLRHDAGHPRIINDLTISLWVKSDHPGMELMAEVFLPRTIDPRTGRPLVTLLRGVAYHDVGRWQELRIVTPEQLLTRQTWLLRSQMGVAVDNREAVLKAVVLSVPGTPGLSNVWIDDLTLTGFASVAAETAAPRPHLASGPVPAGPVAALPAPSGQLAPSVQLAQSVLQIAGRPMFPRAIQYQGEPLQLLKQLGFNAVWLPQPASAELLAEAQRLDLWLICPPPGSPGSTPLGPLGPEFQRVLAWDLGSRLGGEQLEIVSRWADHLRLADAHQHRPLVGAAIDHLRAYSRCLDLLLVDRRPLGSSMEMPDYGTWLRRQPLLARPGTPLWSTVQTQPGEKLRQQVAALAPGQPPPTVVADEQLRLLVYSAITAGSRGLYFQSQTRLDSNDAETRQRALSLELLNLELALIEPWTAAGSFVTTAETNDPRVAGAVLRIDRARLVLPIRLAPGAQFVAAPSTVAPLALIAPGTPESSMAYTLDVSGLQSQRRKRDTGGVRMTLEEFGVTGLLVLAQDPLIVEAVMRRAAVTGKRGAELQRHVAARKLATVSEAVAGLGKHVSPQVHPAEHLAAAQQGLQLCDQRLAAGDYQAACLYARRTLRPLEALERAYWEAATAGWRTPVDSPLAVSFATLARHWTLVQRLSTWTPGPNRLPGGDFEDLGAMLRSGWRHAQPPLPGIHAAADLVKEAAHTGVRGLRLTARADDPENPPAMLETPPIAIVTPPVPVAAGQVLFVHGWVMIPQAILGTVDGLMIVDSLGGEELAERVDKTSGWREFGFYRGMPQNGEVTVTFLLTGLGEVRLDDVTLQVLEPPGWGQNAVSR